MSDKAAFAKAAKVHLLQPAVLPAGHREGKGVQSQTGRGEVGCWGWAILPKEKDRLLPGRQFEGSFGGKGGKISRKRKGYLRKFLK